MPKISKIRKEVLTMPKVSPQDARRNFLIKQYKERGVDGMAQKDVLELFLSFLTTKSRSPILTKDVLNRFGNISEFLHATRDELLSVEGLDSNARLLMTLLPFVARRRCRRKTSALTRKLRHARFSAGCFRDFPRSGWRQSASLRISGSKTAGSFRSARWIRSDSKRKIF